jgi:Glycosyl transferases group 1
MPIISTNVAGIPEIVRNGETGLTVPAGDAVSLTQALRNLATNPAFRMTLGEHAEAHVTRHYDAPTNASSLLGLLKEEANAARAERLAGPTSRYACRRSRITEHRKLATDAFSRHTIRGKCCMDTRPRRGPGTLLAPSPSETTLATARIVF